MGSSSAIGVTIAAKVHHGSALMPPGTSEDTKLVLAIVVLVLLFGLVWWWNRRAKTWLEENGRSESPTSALDWLRGRFPQNPTPAALRYSEQEFQEMVANALDELPEEFDNAWENVAVLVSTEWPSQSDKQRMGVPKGHVVFGTYSGIDRTKGIWSEGSQHVIVIYQPALELRCGSDKHRLQREIRRVVLHELAHHLGMSHQKMREIGL